MQFKTCFLTVSDPTQILGPGMIRTIQVAGVMDAQARFPQAEPVRLLFVSAKFHPCGA
jgi:hypothetical protein